MTYEEAIRLLHPDTSREAIAELKYYNGFNKDKTIDTINEAIILVCEAAEKQIPTCDWEPYKEFVCSKCGLKSSTFYGNYCPVCGQRITIEPVPLNTGLE